MSTRKEPSLYQPKKKSVQTQTESGPRVVKMSSYHGFFPRIKLVLRYLEESRLKMYRRMQYGATTICFPKMNFTGWYRALLRN
jgi:hypothetical protein